MKLLRILTGLHAGAELQLDVLTQRIGKDDEADIRLADWTEPSMRITFDEHGEVQLETQDSANSLENEMNSSTSLPSSVTRTQKITLADWIPQKFGEVVLCVGQAGGKWPNDAQLLSLIFSPQAPAKEAPEELDILAAPTRHKRLLLVAAAVILGIIAININVLSQIRQRAQTEYEATVNTLPNQLQRALQQANITGLEISTRSDVVVINGMVNNSADDAVVREIIEKLNDLGRISPHYDIASRVAQNIAESLDLPNIKVEYLGKGAFQVSGIVADVASAQQALLRLAPDLSSNIKKIDSRLTGIKARTPSYSGLMSDGNVKYVETPDGVKHLYTTEP